MGDSRAWGGPQGQVFEGAGIQHREEKPPPGKLGAEVERNRRKKDDLIAQVFPVRGPGLSCQLGAEES